MADSFLRVGNEMTWPNPETELGWKLRYAHDSLTRSDQLTLASIVDAYRALVLEKTIAQRNYVVREIRRQVSPTSTGVNR